MSETEENATTETTTSEEIRALINEIRSQIVSEDRIKSLINERVSTTETDFTQKLAAIEVTLHLKAEEDRTERKRIENAQAELRDMVSAFVASVENRFSSVNAGLNEIKVTMNGMNSMLSMLQTLMNARNDEINEIHRDVNAIQTDVKGNVTRINKHESDMAELRNHFGEAIAPLTGKNPFNPVATVVLVPLPKRVDEIARMVKDIEEPVQRLLALEEQREKFKTAIWEMGKRVLTSRWFWGALGLSSSATIILEILSQQ